jgi:hypothetical protein
VTFREKAASSVEAAVSYAESHGVAEGRIQTELIAAGVKKAEDFDPEVYLEEREKAKAKETPDFTLQQPDISEPYPPLLLTGSLRTIASAFPVGSTAYSAKTGSALKIVASNLVGDDMLIIQAKSASGIERHVISAKTGLSMVPAPWRRLIAALKEAAGTYFSLYINTAIQEAGLPIDTSKNWDGLLLSVYRKFRWTKDDDTLEEAIYEMLTKLLYAPGTGNGASGLTILQKFDPTKGDQSLPLEKRVSNFIMSRILPFEGKSTAGSDIVKKFILKRHRDIPESQIGDNPEGWDGGKPSLLDMVPPGVRSLADESNENGISNMAVKSTRDAFATYLSRTENPTGARRILTMFDILVDNPYKGDAARADALEEWTSATGTGKQNFYHTRRALAKAIDAFANSSGAPAGETFRSLVNTLKKKELSPVEASSVVASDITPDNIVMPEIDQEEADVRPTIRDRQAAKAAKAPKAPRFATLKRFAEEEPEAVLEALGELKTHYEEQLEKVEALVEHLGGDAEGEDKEATNKWAAPKVGEIEIKGDEQAQTELRLFIENDYQLYHSQMMPIIKNVQRRKAKGTYDPTLAPKLWLYLVDEGARKYVKEFGAPGDKVQNIFPKPVRMALAEEMAKDYSESIDNGEYDASPAHKGSVKAPRYAALKRIAEEEPEEVQEALQELYDGIDTSAEYLEALAENLGVELDTTPEDKAHAEEAGEEFPVEASAKQALKAKRVGNRAEIENQIRALRQQVFSVPDDSPKQDAIIQKIIALKSQLAQTPAKNNYQGVLDPDPGVRSRGLSLASVKSAHKSKQARKLRHNIELLPNGALKISDHDGLAAECRDIFEFMEDATSNGWEWLSPEKIGALTDAPIITNDVEWDENRDEIVGLGDLWWYPQYELYDPLEEIQKNGFVVFTKAPGNKPTGTDDPKTSSTDKTAGPGAGITLELKGLDGHISATYDPSTDALTWTSLPEIDSFDCHDYSHGLSNVRGDLLKVTGVTIEDEAALKADCRSEEDNPNGLPVEIYFSVESFSSFVRGSGYTRSPMGAGEVLQFPVELRPTFVIGGNELHGNYIGATIDTVGTEEFGHFYEDVFDFMPISKDEWDEENDGEWLDEATQDEHHQEYNQANYSKTSSAKMGSALPSYFVLKAVDASGKATYFDGKDFAATKNAGGLRYLDEEGAKSAAKTAGVPKGHTLMIAKVNTKKADVVTPEPDWRVNDFVRSYLETALWSSSDNFSPNGGEPLDSNFSIDDIDNEAQEKAHADCKSFIEQAGDLLEGLDDSQVASDFWLTRNGHGAGFWDGDYEEEVGQKLSDLSHTFGEVDLYVVVYSDRATDQQVPVGEEEGAEDEDVVRDKIRSGEYEAVIYMS